HLVEGAPELRLEHDDHGDDDEERGVAEQPAQQHEVELVSHQADDAEQDQTDEDLDPLRAAQQAQQLVKHQGHHGDIYYLGPPQVVNDLEELAVELAQGGGHRSSPKSSAISAICACSLLPACWNTTDCLPSMTASVTSSPRCAGRQCMNTASGTAAISVSLT